MNLQELTMSGIVSIDAVNKDGIEVVPPYGMTSMQVVPEWGELFVDKIGVIDKKLIAFVSGKSESECLFGNEEIFALIKDAHYASVRLMTRLGQEELTRCDTEKLFRERPSFLGWELWSIEAEGDEQWGDSLLITFLPPSGDNEEEKSSD